MILCFWDGCTRTTEIILLYEKSVDIDEMLKSCGDWYSIVVMIIFMVATSKKRCVIIWDKSNGSMNRRNKNIAHYVIKNSMSYWFKNGLEEYWWILSEFLNIWWTIRCI